MKLGFKKVTCGEIMIPRLLPYRRVLTWSVWHQGGTFEHDNDTSWHGIQQPMTMPDRGR